MANHLGTVKDMEEFKQQIQKQKRQFNKAKKEFLKYFPAEKTEILEIEPNENIIEIEKFADCEQRAKVSACPFNTAKQENHLGISN